MKPLTQGKVEILPWGTISPLLLRAFANQLQDCQKKPTTNYRRNFHPEKHTSYSNYFWLNFQHGSRAKNYSTIYYSGTVASQNDLQKKVYLGHFCSASSSFKFEVHFFLSSVSFSSDNISLKDGLHTLVLLFSYISTN